MAKVLPSFPSPPQPGLVMTMMIIITMAMTTMAMMTLTVVVKTMSVKKSFFRGNRNIIDLNLGKLEFFHRWGEGCQPFRILLLIF